MDRAAAELLSPERAVTEGAALGQLACGLADGGLLVTASRLVEFGDRYFEDESGRTFMHLPDRAEILADLAATGWKHGFDAMRAEVAVESRAVRDFSDECRFWVAHRH